MTLYGVGLGPGAADLITLRGKRVLETADLVYTPGRLSESVAVEYVSESTLSDLSFPMTRDRTNYARRGVKRLERSHRERVMALQRSSRSAIRIFTRRLAICAGHSQRFTRMSRLRRSRVCRR